MKLKTRKYEEMLPHEFFAELDRAPIAWMPCGILEWHGKQNAMGLDGLKAYELCLRAADKAGGIVMPVLWVGSLFLQGAAGDIKPRFIADGLDWRGRTQWHIPTSKEMKDFGIKYGSKIVDFIKTVKQQPVVPVNIKSALGSFQLTYDTQGKILKGKVKTRAELKKLITARSTSEKDRKRYKFLLKSNWYVGGKPQSTWQCQKIQLNDKIQILGVSGETTGGVARLLYNAYKDNMNIFVGYIHRGSYITDWTQQQEGGYEAKGYDSTIDESIINGFKKLKVK